MKVSFLKSGALALAMSLAAGSASAATLGLTTTGPVDSGIGDFDYAFEFSGFVTLATGGTSTFFYDPTGFSPSTFDSLGDVSDVVSYGFVGQVMEFELTAFDGYTNGALLSIDVSSAGFMGDPAAAFEAAGSDISDAVFSLQALEATVQPIPLPGGALLLGTALAGLGFSRKRRTA